MFEKESHIAGAAIKGTFYYSNHHALIKNGWSADKFEQWLSKFSPRYDLTMTDLFLKFESIVPVIINS